MHRVRLFVLWFVMLAVPFQGYAAAAMAFCGPGQAVAAAAAKADAHAMHDHAQHHQAGGDEHAVAQPSADEHAMHGTSAEPDSMHKCANCGACHASALIDSFHLAVFSVLPPADLAEPAMAMATLTPRVLDKPPRA